MLELWLNTGVSALADAATMFLDPKERVFWPFLLCTLVIAAVTQFLRQDKRATTQEPAATHSTSLFAPRLWLHPSSLVDVQLVFAKVVIRALFFAPLIISALTVATFVFELFTRQFGAASPSSWARWQIAALYTITLFVTWDLSRYALHRLMHRIPFLWELHKVHHSALVLTPLTNYRTHPLESFLYALRGVLVTGAVSGAFFYWFHANAVQYDILGVNAFGFLFNATFANLRHSHVWLSFGPLVEHVLISPAQHQLHHSKADEHHDRNYGSVLAVWDWLGGSLCFANKVTSVSVGLPARELNHNPKSLTSSLFRPVVAAATTIFPAKRIRQAPTVYRGNIHETN